MTAWRRSRPLLMTSCTPSKASATHRSRKSVLRCSRKFSRAFTIRSLMMKKHFLSVFAWLVVIALSIVIPLTHANTNPTGTPEWSLERAGSKVRIDAAGAIRVEPRSGQSAIFKSGSTVNFTGATILGLTGTSAITQSLTNGDTTHAPSGDAVFDALALKQNVLTNPVVAAGSGYKVATGVATITGSGTVVT